MTRFRSIGIVVTMLLSLCFLGIINQSDAASITSMSVYSGDDSGSGTTVSASLTADENIDYIDWSIDGVHSSTSMHSGTSSVYVYVGTLAGSPFGRTYTIEAVAWFWDAENNAFTSDTDSYSVTVYTTPASKTETGSWTMAQMSVSVDVGWNGLTAEVTGSASITSYSEERIRYGFNMFYSVVRLNDKRNWAARIWNQPGILFEGGVLKAKSPSSDSAPYSKSDSYDGSGLLEGNYRVQADITVAAQPIEGGKEIDELRVSDSADISISDPN
ncbi:MAG: hypothetical protein OXI67_05590 [Candidatus Poribacteria bacterium]|nr:hypothetical protein [Candidatus Poribacteria bacterium]